jgi:hypothetical protein
MERFKRSGPDLVAAIRNYAGRAALESRGSARVVTMHAQKAA